MCPVADMLADLEADAENADAWRWFHRVFSRFTVDTHVAHVLLTRLIAEREFEDASELMERFTILYDALQPPPETH